jgi:hypothetical protein
MKNCQERKYEMNITSKSAIIFLLLAICMPARSEILIYKKTLKCLTASEDDELWDVEYEIEKGFLVFDVGYDPNGAITSIHDVDQIDYERSGRNKWYYLRDPWFDFARTEIEKGILWVFMEKDTDSIEGEILVMTGKAKDKKIGLGRDEPRGVAKTIKGKILADWITGEGILQICTISLRLHSGWTKRANDADQGNQDFDYAVSDIVMAYLDDKGYQYIR